MNLEIRRGGVLVAAVVVLLLSMALPALTVAQEQDARDDAPNVVLEFEEVAGGFVQPVLVTHAGDGSNRQFVVERTGTVRIVQDGEVLPDPFIDVSDLLSNLEGERGLFAIAFHPQFSENGHFYLHYTAAPDGAVTISRFQVAADNPNQADPASELTLLSVPHPFDTHNGGGLAFGPDGYLYISIGDGGGPEDGDREGNAQNLGTLLGKVLRLDVDGGTPYAIPADNPFVDNDDARPEVWAYGLRNPWRLSFDRDTGDMYISDVGSGDVEEINRERAGDPGGHNYGWPEMEGSQCFPFWEECSDEGYTPPVVEYSHEFGCSVSGAQVYRGQAAPFFRGNLVFADWCSGRVWMATPSGEESWDSTQLQDSDFGITSIGEDEAGELYLTDMWAGGLYQLVFQEIDSSLVIDSVDPPGAIAGSADFQLTVRGAGFSEGSVVRWNARPLPTTFVSESELVADVSADDLGTIASIDITITVATNGVEGRVSNAVIFAVNAFADPAFEETWKRTDKVLVDMEAVRTWIWGPRPITSPRMEAYLESPDNERLVQYFDKSRMEITDPAEDQDSLWYVTNGLLVVEMMSGDVQIGDGDFETREPAEVNIAGDATDPDGVTYATFATLSERLPFADGEVITATVDREGTVSEDPAKAVHDVTAGPLVIEKNHRVASVFWEFMTSEGLVYDGEEQTEAPLFENPFYATGYPITEAYWTTVEVAGTPREVLVQAFERRVLTFTPDNSPEWQVEAGNVGRHYYVWRYGEHLLPFNR